MSITITNANYLGQLNTLVGISLNAQTTVAAYKSGLTGAINTYRSLASSPSTSASSAQTYTDIANYGDSLLLQLNAYSATLTLYDVLYGDAQPTTPTPTPTPSVTPPTTYGDISSLLDTSFLRYTTLTDTTSPPQAISPPIRRTVDNSQVPWGKWTSSYSYTATDANGSTGTSGDTVTIGSYLAQKVVQDYTGPMASYPIVGGHSLEGTGITIGDPIVNPIATPPQNATKTATTIQNIYTDYSKTFLSLLIKLGEINLTLAIGDHNPDAKTVTDQIAAAITKLVADLKSQVGADLGGKAADAFLNFTRGLKFVDNNSFNYVEQPGGSQVTGGPQKNIFMGTAFVDDISGGASDDIIYSGGGNDSLTGGGGNDTLVGDGVGIVTANYSRSRSAYTVTKNTDGTYTSRDNVGTDGTDVLTKIDRLKFSDGTLALDVGTWQVGGEAYRLYQAAFGRSPDNTGLKYWISQMGQGQTHEQVAHNFIVSNEFKTLYGNNPSNSQLVTALYHNVLGREPDQGGYSYWLGLLNAGQITSEQLLINFSESNENVALVGTAIQNGIWLIA